MPAATHLSEVKNVAKAVELALHRAHAAVGGQAVLVRSPEDNEDVWILPIFNLGPASGHRYKRPDGQWDFDLFRDCVIEWELSVPRLPGTARETLAATYTLFDQELTRIALAMDPSRWASINADLPYHTLTKLIPAGTVQGYDPERAEDRATVRYTCWLGVRPAAWPMLDSTKYFSNRFSNRFRRRS